MTRPLLAYLAALVTIGLLDFLWLGVIARDFYRQGMGALMAPTPNLKAAAAFYLLYPVGLMVFAVMPSDGDWVKALTLGALFGLFAYGTYDLTALAVLRDWPVSLSLVDIAWGAALSAAAATAGALAWRAVAASS